MSPRPVLALDLGGTQIRAAVVLPDGTRHARVADETPSEAGPDAIVAACAALAQRARDEAGDVGASVAGLGVSSPGPVDPFTGTVVEPPNLGPHFRDIPLADRLAEMLDLPVFLDRDTNVAALGEASFGAGRGCDDFIYLTVSTGVGGGIVAGGRLFRGPDGRAGELGHVPVELDGPVCGCGGIGHLEAVASGVALARDARAAVADDASPYLAGRARVVGVDELSAKDVAEGDALDDEACTRLMGRARRAVATACVGFVNALNPHRIIIGGAIAHGQGDKLLGPIRRTIDAEAFRDAAERVEILPPQLGPDVSLAGAYPLVTGRLAEPARAGQAYPAIHPSIHARSA